MLTRKVDLRKILKSFLMLWMIMFMFGFPTRSWSLDGADVAIFDDTSYPSGGAWPEGLDAIKAMLDFYGYTHENITPDQINNTSDLNSLYEVIIFGGGWAGGYNTYINYSGFRNIRRFVSNGGGYFGICAGAYFACDVITWKEDWETPLEIYNYPLNLFRGIGVGVVLGIKEWTSPTGCDSVILEGAAMTTLKVNNSILPDISSDLNILYYGGPLFRAFKEYARQSIIVATYELPGAPADKAPAMILFTFGKGKVFLSGPHPEVSFENCSLFYDENTWILMDTIISLLVADLP